MARTTVVGQTGEPQTEASSIQAEERQPGSSGDTRQSRLVAQDPIGGLPILGKSLCRKGFDKDTVLLLMEAWRPSTKISYSTYLRKWSTYYVEKSVNVLHPTLPQVCRFLRVLVHQGFGYGALNTARCALSTILPSYEGYSFGNHPYSCWIIKASYERNPPKARYDQFWDVNLVFQMLKDWGPTKELSLKKLSVKLVMLLLLVSSQRGQTIKNLPLDGMVMESDKVVFKMKSILKHNRVGDRLDTLIFKEFPSCKRLCVVRTIKEYVNKTETLRSSRQLLVSFVKPHGGISRDTLARWTLRVMVWSGIDTDKYGGHSTRGASTSAAKRQPMGVPMNLILKQASWRSATSFANYYDKELDSDPGQVGQALLRAAVS